jgi:hypothetical protein
MNETTDITNPAKRLYANAMKRRIEASSAVHASPVSKGLMGMSRRQPEEQKKTTEPIDIAQEMFNTVRDQRKKLYDERT